MHNLHFNNAIETSNHSLSHRLERNVIKLENNRLFILNKYLTRIIVSNLVFIKYRAI